MRHYYRRIGPWLGSCRSCATTGPAGDDFSPSSPPKQLLLRKAAWLRQDPVAKWTMLLDAGRNVHKLLAQPQDEQLPSSSLVGRAISIAKQVLGKVGVKRAPNVQQHHQQKGEEANQNKFQALPYDFRLRIILSSLMWIRSIRDVQDTIAREHLPYSEQRRIGKALCCLAYPMRMAERWVDNSITVNVLLGEENETGEQIPAPHLWDTSKAEYIYDHIGERTISLQQTVGRGEVSKGELLARVKNLLPKPSEDDEECSKQQKMMLLPRMRSRGRRQLAAGISGSRQLATVGEVPKASSAQRDMILSSRVSPMWADPAMHAEDEAFHKNSLRGAGCPLDEQGDCTSTPIFIDAADSRDLATGLVAAHAAILSAMFIEGRTAHFSTNSPVILDYVRNVFSHLIEEKFLAASLVNTSDGCHEGLIPYIPPWFYRHAVVVLGSSTANERRKAAEFVVWCAPHCVMCETEETSRAVRDECAQIALEGHWNVATVSWLVLPSASHDVSDRLIAAAGSFLPHYHFISVVTPDALAKRVERVLLQHFPRSNTAPIIGVNYPATASMQYFPMAPLLVKKLGNCFRYFHPERAVISRPYRILNSRRSVLSHFAGSGGTPKDGSVLVLERSLDYLANPCKYTILTLFAAKWFRI